ncbi:MAG TPA: endonuclease III [Longimicrobiaceae bacterium]|nr:endonuclease III [Longimicrobiaceae bacterium]
MARPGKRSPKGRRPAGAGDPPAFAASAGEAPPRPDKRPFDIHEAMRRVAAAVEHYPKAALFELAELGHDTPFAQLVACILSIRTLDETMLPTALALFERARTPAEVAALGPEEIDRIIRSCTFHEGKSRQIHEIARTVAEEHGGELPCDEALMLGFRGVGPKCTNLVLGIACGAPKIGVDVHVHRVTNRWGYVSASTPERTMQALEEMLPEEYHVEINRLLVPFGKHVCTGRAPKCSACPVLDMCRQVGVTTHR